MGAKIKAKIWANEYIDFGALLSVAPPREKFALSMVPSWGAVNQPQLTFRPSHTPKKVTNISQWLTAFNTFVSIYCEKCSPELYPWDQIHWELWLRAMTNFRAKSQSFTGSDRTTPRGRFRTSTPPFPRGTCWSFHSGRHCRGCQYEHVCFKCGAKHPATQCQNQNSHLRTNPVKSGASISAQPSGQFPSNSRKSGPV